MGSTFNAIFVSLLYFLSDLSSTNKHFDLHLDHFIISNEWQESPIFQNRNLFEIQYKEITLDFRFVSIWRVFTKINF